jgi:hypothetical protein
MHLVALASFLILGLTGAGPDSASDLPVVDIGQTDESSGGQDGTENPQSASEGALTGAQTTPEAQQGGGQDQGASDGAGGNGPASGLGQQSGSGQQGGLMGQGGYGPSTSTTAGASPPGTANTAAPSTETSGTTPTGSGPGAMGASAGTGMTGSILRQTVNGGVRVEGGPGNGQGMGPGSSSPASGGAR